MLRLAGFADDLHKFLGDKGATVGDGSDDEGAEDEEGAHEEGETEKESGKPKPETETAEPEHNSEEDDDEVEAEARAHYNDVTTWGANALKVFATVCKMIPDNPQGEKLLIRILGGYVAPCIRQMKELEKSWDPDGKDLMIRVGIRSVRMLMEYLLVGITKGLRLNQKEVDSAGDKAEKEDKNQLGKDISKERKDKGQVLKQNKKDLQQKVKERNKQLREERRRRQGAASGGGYRDSEAETDTEEHDEDPRAAVYAKRLKRMEALLKPVFIVFRKLFRKSLGFIPHQHAEIPSKPKAKGILRRKKSEMIDVKPYLLRLRSGLAKSRKKWDVLKNNQEEYKKMVKLTGNPFVLTAYDHLLDGICNDTPVSALNIMVKMKVI